MKKLIFIIVGIIPFAFNLNAVEVIRINQLGYQPHAIKVAVFLASKEYNARYFTLHDAITDKVVFKGKAEPKSAKEWGMKSAYRLNFSAVSEDGGYYLKVGEARSPNFRIDADVYEGTADFLLNYMRQQRCGYNPFLEDSCHLHDGIIVDHPTRTGEFINIIGGWHDATDYLQYSKTSVNAIFQMLFAYKNYPDVWGDFYDASGDEGANGIPDILDEIKWGLNWMLKMNPAPGEMYNQIADDRDHIGFRLPTNDPADYGLGNSFRPVYYVTGESQGLAEFKNTTTGVSSVAGKFASSFALAAEMFSETDPVLSNQLKQKALDAFEFALSDTGYTQTACNVSPYYYEEKNYADDLQLAATQLYRLTKDKEYLEEAEFWGKKEPISPWIKNDTAGHYESYPFVNLGHYFMMQENGDDFAEFYKNGLQLLHDRGKDDPFFNGLPFLWCSNNLVAGAITQARLYREKTGNTEFAEMEAGLRDWLFGCNPWGTAMICGLPGAEDSPMLPHSSYTVVLGGTTPGGLVDGPIDARRHKNQIGIALQNPDEYSAFNNGKAVYHDDIGDYATNEPTMDGTASLSYYLAALEADGQKVKAQKSGLKDSQGAVIRKNPEEKTIYLAFTADSLFEGSEHVLDVLKKNKIEASFFLTGNFLRMERFHPLVNKMIQNGHYIGPHSNKHLLYCDWGKRDSTLISQKEFVTDLKTNFAELEKLGIQPEDAKIFMPPYEWYNSEVVGWSRDLGLEVVNFTPQTGTNADYTTPEMKNYKSSEDIYSGLMNFEKNHKHGLNGAIVLIHPGTSEKRTDKFYLKLNDLISELAAKGYRFKPLNN